MSSLRLQIRFVLLCGKTKAIEDRDFDVDSSPAKLQNLSSINSGKFAGALIADGAEYGLPAEVIYTAATDGINYAPRSAKMRNV